MSTAARGGNVKQPVGSTGTKAGEKVTALVSFCLLSHLKLHRLVLYNEKDWIGLSHLLIRLLYPGGSGAPRRQAWDLKGKVSDMEEKINKYQTRVKSVNQENEVLKGSMAQSQVKAMEMEREVQKQRSQIRCEDGFIQENVFNPAFLLF